MSKPAIAAPLTAANISFSIPAATLLPPWDDLGEYPRSMTLRYAPVDFTDPAVQAAMAKFTIAVLGWYRAYGTDLEMANIIRAIQKPSGCKVGSYAIFNEHKDPVASNESQYPSWQKLEAENWWLRNAAGQKVQWSSSYGAWDVNITSAMQPDSNGLRWSEYYADYLAQVYTSVHPQDFIYLDNMWGFPRNTSGADYFLTGQNISYNDAAVGAAWRDGQRRFYNRFITKTGLPILGNTDPTFFSDDMMSCLHGGYFEDSLWWGSVAADWNTHMARYHRMCRMAAWDGVTAMDAVASDTVDADFWRVARLCVCSAMLDNGLSHFRGQVSTQPNTWLDEYDNPIGYPLESPQTVPYDAAGCYRRVFSGGMVLVNPTASPQSITIGSGYTRFTGSQDATTNSGASVASAITVGSMDGILLLKL